MDGNSSGIAVALFVLILLSAFFSSCETAFTSVNRVRLKSMANAGDKRAAKALLLDARYDELLSTILIGNNIVNILSTSLATVVFVRYFGDAGVTVSTIVMTILILMIGEIVPKSISKQHAEAFAIRLTGILGLLMAIFKPLNFVMSKWSGLVSRLVRPRADAGITEEELLTYVEEAISDGSIEQHESDLIRSAIEFDDLCAEDILTPRVDIVSIDLEDSREEISEKFREHGFSRMPVCKEDVDNIIGVLHEKDFFFSAPSAPIEDLMSLPTFVLPTVRLSALLKLLQNTKCHMAVVMDEYGGVQGIVTMEDILEELVGEIWDEHDEVVEEFEKLPDGALRVAGAANLDKMLEILNIEQDYEPTTVSGWVVEQFGNFPDPGDAFDFEGLHVTVEEIGGHRVESIHIAAGAREEERQKV